MGERENDMGRIRKSRILVAAGAALLVGLTVGTMAAAAGTGGTLYVSPRTGLTNSQSIVVKGKGFTPGDQMILMECLRTAADPTGCDPATSTNVLISATGKLPATPMTAVTGNVGTGTCGTSKTDARNCEIAAQDLTTKALFVATRGIKFASGHGSSAPPGPPTPPTVPTTIPTTIPATPTLP
jgi:hypothetical protein